MRLFFIAAIIILSQPIHAQHYGGLLFSGDFIASKKYVGSDEQKNDFFGNNNFTQGFTIGFQGLLFQEKRFSFTYGLHYSSKSALEDYTGMLICATGLDLSTYVAPKSLEEKWQNIEIPLGVRINLLRSANFQPYISGGIIPFYPLNYEAWLTDKANNVEKVNDMTDNYRHRVDVAVEAGVGLNYKLDKFLFNLHTSLGHVFSNTEFGIGVALMRKF